MAQQLHQKFNLTTFDDGETVEDYALHLSGMAAHLTTLGKEVKDGEIITKMLRSLPPRFKQIMIVIKTLLDVSTMSVADLTGHSRKRQHRCNKTGSCTSPRRSGTRRGRSVRQGTTPAATQEVVAQAKAMDADGVTVVIHQAGHRSSPLAMSVGVATRWGIGHVSVTQSPRWSRHMSHKMKRRHRSCSRR
jgi:hypothetical protein